MSPWVVVASALPFASCGPEPAELSGPPNDVTVRQGLIVRIGRYFPFVPIECDF